MKKPPIILDRAKLHGLLDVWMDRVAEDPERADRFFQGAGFAPPDEDAVGLFLVATRKGSGMDAKSIVLMLSRFAQFLISGGKPQDAPLEQVPHVDDLAEARKTAFNGPRPPSPN